MASSPSSRRAFYNHNNKDHPGCMGGLMQLFDFNQGLAGRKLLTDKKCSGALGPPRSSLDVGGTIPEILETNVEKSEEVTCRHELQKGSGPRNLNGMPIKAMIAQELLKESDKNNRSPSVVARLMGLDALPADPKVLQKSSATSRLVGKADEKFAERSVVDRQRHEEITPHNARLYAKRGKASIVSGKKDSVPHHCDGRAGSSGSEAIYTRKHPQEQQLQQFKKEFEALQSQKAWGHANKLSRLDVIQPPMPSQHVFQCGKQFSTIPALCQESLAVEKQIALQNKLHESKEFQDALDFLQTNKEFFLRFLHQPNSVFARHLQADEFNRLSPPQMTKGMRNRVPHQVPDASEGSSPHFWVKGSPISSQYHKIAGRAERPTPPSWAVDLPALRSPKGETKVERAFSSTPHCSCPNSKEALGLQGRYRRALSPMAPENKLNNADCHIPTRIVVLKPNSGKVQNSKSVSPIYCRSPRDQKASEGLWEDGMDVFERLRQKVWKDTGGEYKCENRSTEFIDNEMHRVVSKNPREIAREIARQVRENVSKDLMVDPRCLSNVLSMANLGAMPTLATDSQDSDVDACGLIDDRYHHPRSTSSSLRPDTNLELGGFCESKDNIERVPGQGTTRCNEESGETMLQGLVLVSNNDSFFEGRDNQFFSGQEVSHTSKGSGECCLSKLHDASCCCKPTGQVENGERSVVYESVEEYKADLSRASLRHELATLSFPEYENGGLQNMITLHVYGRNSLEDGPLENGSATVSFDDMTADLKRAAGENLDALQSASESCYGTKLVNTSSNLRVKEVKQTVVGMKDLVGSHAVEKVAVAKENKPVQKNGQGCESPYSGNTETVEALSLRDDAHVHPSLNIVTTSPPFVSLPSSISSLDDTAGPTKEHTEPSPVSILDPPFQEELVVPPKSKELGSDLEELYVHLCLLNSSSGDNALDDDDPKIKNAKKSESGKDASVHLQKICVTGGGHSKHSDSNEYDAMDRNSDVVSDSGEVSESLYVKNLLDASGFTEVGSTVLTQWYAPGQPLNPCLFQEMERSAFDPEKDFVEQNQSNLKVCKQGKEISSASRRRLLFDCADEALSKVLGPHFNCRVWLALPKQLLCVPTGQDLATAVWSSVWCSVCSHSGVQQTLENLVTRDLHEGHDWCHVDPEIEATGLDVERAILNDLLEEALLVL